MSTPTDTPTETSPTQQHVDDVVESLERAFTLLKRRTRDVLKLAQEREELMAAIENRASRVAPAPVEADGGTAVHGVSSAPETTDETSLPDRSEGEPTPFAPSVAEISDVSVASDVASPSTAPTENPHSEPTAADHRDEVSHEPRPPEPVSIENGVGDPTAPPAEAAAIGKWAQRAPVRDGHDEEYLTDAPELEEAEPAPAPATAAVASWDDTPQQLDDTHDALAQHEEPASPTPAWETPDLEWSDDAPPVAPREFPHPMPPVDSAFVEPDDAWETADATSPDVDAAEWDEAAHETQEVPYDAPEPAPEQSDDSPFAAEFEEHVEEVGGSLESSPFDLDSPPEPTSYRPRSFQSERESDAVTASSLIDQGDETTDDRSVKHVEAAWDDFAGDRATGITEQRDDPTASNDTFAPSDPAPANTGSRLRDLVAQAREAEQVRSEQEKSDFDLINEDASVSRYDKNSAKLPTVGISSEELSSSVASLRSSFTSDKRRTSDGDGESRSDKRADKRAAKEAAKAAKAEAKRKRNQGD